MSAEDLEAARLAALADEEARRLAAEAEKKARKAQARLERAARHKLLRFMKKRGAVSVTLCVFDVGVGVSPNSRVPRGTSCCTARPVTPFSLCASSCR